MKTKRKILVFVSGIVLSVLFSMAQIPVVYAAGEASVRIVEDTVKLGLGETTIISVDYTGGFSDLAVVSSDSTVAAAMIADAGNGHAALAIAGTGIGTAAVAVYRISNPAYIDYVAVQSGLAADGEIISRVDESLITTIYDDRIIQYQAVLTGRNGAQMAVTGLVLERESGVDCLKVSGELWMKDSQTPGMTVFYANYYDAAGGLMKRQAVYTRDPQANAHMELKWYIPDGCVRVVLE